MARTMAGLPEGTRVSDYLGIGVITKTFPRPLIQRLLTETDRTSQRERALPAPVMVYYVIALALFMQVSYREELRALLEGVRWLAGPDATVHPCSPSGISQARTRLGEAPVAALREAGPDRHGSHRAWYRAHRIVSLDGTTLDGPIPWPMPPLGRPSSSRGVNTTGAFPQLRLFGARRTRHACRLWRCDGAYAESEPRSPRGAPTPARHALSG